MSQKIETPNSDDLSSLESQRNWVKGHLTPETQATYVLFGEKLRLLQAILDAGWIKSNETMKLQCLGITLGDALVQKLGLEWVMVEDEYGRDPAIRVRGTTVLMFPKTMISKRVERGETIDVMELFNGVAKLSAKAEKNADRLA